MLEGHAREILLGVAEQLLADLGHLPGDESPVPRSSLVDAGAMSGILSPEDEELVITLRSHLAKIATWAGTGPPEDRSEATLRAALDGAEMVMRGELARGNWGRLLSVMPSFVFLVVAPVAGQDQAIDLSRRAELLIEEAFGD